MLHIGNAPYHNRLQTELNEISQRPVHGVDKLGQLAQQFAGTAVYVEAQNMAIPLDDGCIAVTDGSVCGELRGFAQGHAYQTATERTKLVKRGAGKQVSAIVATQNMQPFDTTWKAWRSVFPGHDAELESEFAVQGVVPVLVPLGNQSTFHRLHPMTRLHSAPEDVLAKQVLDYDETDIVATIHAISRHRLLTDAPHEQPLHSAILGELSTLNAISRHVTSMVQIRARSIRTPKPGGTGFLETEGTVSGVLRKFVYEAYKPAGSSKHIGAVHAIVYDKRVAAAVSSGRLSPRQAEELPLSARIPIIGAVSLSRW